MKNKAKAKESAKEEMAEVKKKLPGGKGYKYEYAMKMHKRKS